MRIFDDGHYTNGFTDCLIVRFPWGGISDSLWAKEIRAMPAAVKLREDFSAGTNPSLAARSRPCSKASAFPIAAIKAEAIMTPTPGIVVNLFASSCSLVIENGGGKSNHR